MNAAGWVLLTLVTLYVAFRTVRFTQGVLALKDSSRYHLRVWVVSVTLLYAGYLAVYALLVWLIFQTGAS